MNSDEQKAADCQELTQFFHRENPTVWELQETAKEAMRKGYTTLAEIKPIFYEKRKQAERLRLIAQPGYLQGLLDAYHRGEIDEDDPRVVSQFE